MTLTIRVTETARPEWEEPCWLVAIHKTLGTDKEKIKKLALRNGWNGVDEGAKIHTVLQIVWDLIGHMPDVTLTKPAAGMTPRQFSGSELAGTMRGLVFTREHVMPLVRGAVSNFNGYGDDKIIAVATY